MKCMMEWEPEQYVNKQSYKVDGFYTNGDEEQQIISVYKLGANGIFAIKDLYRFVSPVTSDLGFNGLI